MKETTKSVDMNTLVEMTEKKLQECLNINHYKYYVQKSVCLKDALENFNFLMQHFRQFPFAYWDVLNEEYHTYLREEIPVLSAFSGETILIPFTSVVDISGAVITADGVRIPYPESLKKGNPAIGQAWLTGGEMVFSPREAIAHSIDSTAQRILDWLVPYLRQIQRR